MDVEKLLKNLETFHDEETCFLKAALNAAVARMKHIERQNCFGVDPIRQLDAEAEFARLNNEAEAERQKGQS